MTYRDLARASEQFYPAVRVETVLSRRARRLAATVLEWVAVAALLGGAALWWQRGSQVLLGWFLLSVVAWMIVDLANAFFNSYYYLDVPLLSFETASLVYHNDEKDLTKSFLLSPWGRVLLGRLGLGLREASEFLETRTRRLSAGVLTFEAPRVGLTEYGRALLATDPSLGEWLFGRGLGEADWLGALAWLERAAEQSRRRERWWSREALGRIPGLGKDWAYGETFKLEQYAEEIGGAGSDRALLTAVAEDVERLEAVLARSREANAVLVGGESGLLEAALAGLAEQIALGRVVPALEPKRIFKLETELLFAAAADQTSFEREFVALLASAVKAGNIILVFDNFPSLVTRAAVLGAPVGELLAPFLGSPALQLVGLALTEAFEQGLAADRALLEHFEVVRLTEKPRESLLAVLEDEALRLEAREGVWFTYPALAAALESAERYFPGAVLPDKAIDLLLEAAPEARQAKQRRIGRDEIVKLVAAKTHVPAGELPAEEKTKLLRLEQVLHERVIGQEEAVAAIANAMRRARTGLANPKRPLGSFLFLGPTGVGKTETAKALAASFFGDETAMIRLDMSEFAGSDAIPKLIGSFGSGEPGVLAKRLDERPYGVVLLDEFEKSSSPVRDLFLQILDEGQFSDMAGRRVSARAAIIIATSNAGSELIWQQRQEAGPLSRHKTAILEAIVKSGQLKPELLNRFDGVILFRPLGTAELKSIARLLLQQLAARLAPQGFKLVVTETLVDFVAQAGNDPAFGARPLARAIQDRVERAIANKIITGGLAPGASLELTPEELNA